MHSDSNAPRGFGGLASLISVLPAPSTAPRRTIVADVDLAERPSGMSFRMAKRAVITFGVAFVATGIILAIQPSIGPQQRPSRPDAPSNTNSGPLPQASEPYATSSDPKGSPDATHALPLDEHLQEAPPPRGARRMLNASEIGYCLSEGVRVDAMRSLINSKSSVQVRNFTLRISNFKLRCANLRYENIDIDRVKKSIEARSSQLKQEAASIVARWSR